MTRLATSLLALALVATAGNAAAQSHGAPYGDAPYGSYGRTAQPDPRNDRGAHYDWARVVRVDPVFVQGRGYPARDDRDCWQRRDAYAGTDPYGDDRYGGYDGYDGRGDAYRNDPYRNDPYRNDPYRDARRDGNGRMIATVVGGIAGAVLGSKIGDGSGQYIGTAVGSMVGGMAGRGIYDANRRQREVRDGYVTVCDPEPYYGGAGGYGTSTSDRAVDQYDVTYEYGGRHYSTRTNYHPGDRIRVRVDVRAE